MINYLRMSVVSFLVIISMALSHAATAAKTTKEAIYKSITTLSNSISKTTAWLYADIIERQSTAFGVDPFLVVAIAKIESDFVLNKKNGYYRDVYTDGGEAIKKYVTTDYCMMQINQSNLSRLKISARKLLSDPEYCIRSGIKILASFKQFKRHEPYWWTRYNSPSSKHRTIYKKNVLRFYKKAVQEIV